MHASTECLQPAYQHAQPSINGDADDEPTGPAEEVPALLLTAVTQPCLQPAYSRAQAWSEHSVAEPMFEFNAAETSNATYWPADESVFEFDPDQAPQQVEWCGGWV